MAKTAADRFWRKVEWGPHPNGCLLWQGAKDTSGYGNFNVGGGKFKKAHVFAFEAKNGPIPVGKFVLHTCDTPACVNHAHLYAGTKQQNAADREARGRGNHPTGARHGCATHPGLRQGQKNGRAKVTESDVKLMRSLHRDGASCTSLAKVYGLTKTTVSNILRGKLWGHVEG